MTKLSYMLLTAAISSTAFLSSCVVSKSDNKQSKQFDISNFKLPEETQRQLQEQFYNVQNQITGLLNNLKVGGRSEKINLKEPVAFHTVSSNAGILYVKVESVEKRQDGYRLKLNVGNPLACDFNNVTLKIQWSGDKKPQTDKNPEKEKSVQINEIPSSSWKIVEAILSGVSSEKDLENVSIVVEVKQVKLLR